MSEIAVNRFSGCLVGQALGDALGFAVEGCAPDVCAEYVESFVSLSDPAQRARRRVKFGQYSDDTQLARELVRSFVEQDGFEPADYALRIAALFTENRIVGRGRATAAAALRMAHGTPWHDAGTPPPAAGNGSAMRVAPVGLLFAHDQVALVRVVHDQGRMTHQDRRCSAGAIAIAGMTAYAARAEALDVLSACSTVADWVSPFDTVLADALLQLPRWVEEPPRRAVEIISRIGLEPDAEVDWDGISPFVTPSVLWSLYAALRSPTNYWEAISTAIAVGGDVDTTAAMTGAIVGASVGLDGLPHEVAKLVHDRDQWGYDDLVEFAERLHRLHRRLRRDGAARFGVDNHGIGPS